MPLRHIAVTGHHALHLLHDPPPLSQRTFQARYKKRPEEADRQVLLRTCRFSCCQLDDLVHSAVDSCLQVSAHSVSNLQNLKFITQRPATAMMQVNAHDAPDDLLGLNEEAKRGPHNGIVDKISWFREKVIVCHFLVYWTIVHNTTAEGRLSANGTARFVLRSRELSQAAEFY
ncbi:hypothetical protein GB937_002691 [Aspergillus fischeri]|nr:hypothetical protein GB937_002691 [Aspergillus fischeri]